MATFLILPAVLFGADAIDIDLSRKGDVSALLTPVGVSETIVFPDERAGKVNGNVNSTLQSVPGLYGTQKELVGLGVGPAGAGTLSIRGSQKGQRTVVLIDGRPNMMGIFGHPLNDAYGMGNVQQIDVVRGPDSVRYGNGALAGSINIHPKRLYENGSKLSILGLGGSYGTWGSLAEYGSRNDQLDSYLTGSYRSTDGHRPHSAANIGDMTALIGVRPSAHMDVVTNAHYTDSYVEDPGSLTELASAEAAHITVDKWSRAKRSSVDMTMTNQNPALPWSAKAFMDYGDNVIRNTSVGANNYKWDSIDRTFGGSLLFSPATNATQKIDLGVDGKAIGGEGFNLTAGQHFSNTYRSEGGVFGLYNGEWFEKLKGSAGFRAHVHEEYGWEAIPQAGLEYKLLADTALRASVAKGFRSPTLYETWNKLYANETLEPERAWNYEAGFNQKLGSRGVFDLTAFYLKGQNLLRTPTPAVQLFYNSGEFQHRGLEAGLDLMVTSDIKFNSTATLLDPDEQTQGNPKQKYYAGLDYLFAKGRVGADVEYVADLYGADKELSPLPNYTLTGIGADYKPTKRLKLFARIDNLFNEAYQIVSGYPMTDRTFSGGAAWEF